MKLGNIRAMWLLGATPNECDVEPRKIQPGQKKPRKRRRVTQDDGSHSAANTQARGERPNEDEDDSSDAEPSEGKRETLSATQKFLRELREKRAKVPKCQT